VPGLGTIHALVLLGLDEGRTEDVFREVAVLRCHGARLPSKTYRALLPVATLSQAIVLLEEMDRLSLCPEMPPLGCSCEPPKRILFGLGQRFFGDVQLNRDVFFRAGKPAYMLLAWCPSVQSRRGVMR